PTPLTPPSPSPTPFPPFTKKPPSAYRPWLTRVTRAPVSACAPLSSAPRARATSRPPGLTTITVNPGTDHSTRVNVSGHDTNGRVRPGRRAGRGVQEELPQPPRPMPFGRGSRSSQGHRPTPCPCVGGNGQ